MPSRLTYPGVYVEEQSSGVRTITGVATSTAMIIGMARLGPIGVPVAVRSFDQFEQTFGDDLNYGEIAGQTRQFFLNGGAEAYIVRAANGFASSEITLQSESGTDDVLTLTALDAGDLGNQIRAEVDYDTVTPELTFNLTLYREVVDANGVVSQTNIETYGDLSMDPALANHVETVINGSSTLVSAAASATPSGGDRGFSQSGLILDATDGTAFTTIQGLVPGATNQISISVDGGAPVTVRLPDPTTAADLADWEGQTELAIGNALTSANQAAGVTVTTPTFGTGQALRITSASGATVTIASAAQNDAAVILQLGSAQGGIEIGAFSRYRPAPSGYATRISSATTGTLANNTNLNRLTSFAGQTRASLNHFELSDSTPGTPYTPVAGLNFPGAGTTFLEGDTNSDGIGSLRNVAAHLETLRAALMVGRGTDMVTIGTNYDVALHGLRLVITPKYGNANTGPGVALTSPAPATFDIGGASQIAEAGQAANTAAYSLGTSGTATRQTGGVGGLNGVAPLLADYENIFARIEQEVDLFNIMLLPRGDAQTDAARALLWGSASAFCRNERAFLLIDPPSDNGAWTTVDQAAAGIGDVRLGVVGDHAAIYWPRIRVPSGAATQVIDPCGTVAGVMARTDVRRGVWKAPAGLEARTLGAVGFERLVCDRENGVTNPQAINTIRRFQSGGVIWGARTLAGFDNSGQDDYKYVPVRRLALFLEESLYRGLQFAVFEPNDEPLWAQIRLAAGAFMQNLFRQGAFQGQKASDAYQVLCDANTTTQNDINLGRVNVIVKFAPLKPAEFVVLIVRQLAGQVQT